jgi:hypothetical protein
MVELYSRLRTVDPNMLPDSEFVKHLVILMTNAAEWRFCRYQLRESLRVAEQLRHPMTSAAVIQQMIDEEVEMGVAPSVTAIMAVKAESGGRKRKRDTHGELPTAYYSVNSQETASQAPSAYFSGNSAGDCTNKRSKPNNPSNNRSTINTTLFCENPNCEYPVGHTKPDCFVWGGRKAGSYPPNY